MAGCPKEADQLRAMATDAARYAQHVMAGRRAMVDILETWWVGGEGVGGWAGGWESGQVGGWVGGWVGMYVCGY